MFQNLRHSSTKILLFTENQNLTFKDEAQNVLFKDPVRTAL